MPSVDKEEAIRRKALEEAAKIAEDYFHGWALDEFNIGRDTASHDIAEAIRALANKPLPKEVGPAHFRKASKNFDVV